MRKYEWLVNGPRFKKGQIVELNDEDASFRLILKHIRLTEEEQKEEPKFTNKIRASETLKEAKVILKDIKFWLAFGTSLGAYRDKDFCFKDEKDIDLGVNAKDYDEVVKLLPRFLEKGFILHHHWKPEDGIAPEISLKKVYAGFVSKIDIFFFTQKKDKMIVRIYGDTEGKKYRTKEIKNYFKKFQSITFYGEEYNIPEQIEDYLTDNYGDWKTPQKNWHWYNDNKLKEI